MTALAYPHPKGAKGKCGGLIHPTGGLPGNVALDFMAPGGTLVLAPQAGVVQRLSGHNPVGGVYPGAVFGWSVYIDVADGFYFSTHYGARYVSVGTHVKAGDVIGRVGHWPHDEGRSHTHLGFTHDAAAFVPAWKRIEAVASAPRVKPVWTMPV